MQNEMSISSAASIAQYQNEMWFSNEICVSTLYYQASYIIILLLYIILLYYTITIPIFYIFSAPNYQFFIPTIFKVYFEGVNF